MEPTVWDRAAISPRHLRSSRMVCVFLIIGGAGPAFAGFIAFRAEQCFAALGLELRIPGPRGVGEQGVAYSPQYAAGGASILEISIAIHRNAERASAVLRDVRSFQRRPSLDRSHFAIGDEGYLFGDQSSGGTLRFRRDNLSVQVLWMGPLNPIFSKLQELDQLIDTNTNITVRGEFSETAEIESLPVTRALDSEPVEVRPVVRGMGPPEGLLLWMERIAGEGEPVVLGGPNHWGLRAKKFDHIPPIPVTSAQPDGTQVTEMKRIEVSPRGRAIIRVMVANRDHVFLTRDFEVPVAP